VGRIDIVAEAPGVEPGLAYERIASFEQYPAHCDAVRKVTMLDSGASTVTSSWEVNFRRGVLCWTERATLQASEGLITFEQVDGDVDEFSGFWSVAPAGDRTRVRFFVEFDVGVPTLDHLLDPIAEEALYDNIVSIVRGLLGDRVEIVSAKATSRKWPS
jgi:ribosome-associated toxin RatA of RatAB toxin-antitoxin module